MATQTHAQKLKAAAQTATQPLDKDEVHRIFVLFTEMYWVYRERGHSRKALDLQIKRNVIAAKLGYWDGQSTQANQN